MDRPEPPQIDLRVLSEGFMVQVMLAALNGPTSARELAERLERNLIVHAATMKPEKLAAMRHVANWL